MYALRVSCLLREQRVLWKRKQRPTANFTKPTPHCSQSLSLIFSLVGQQPVSWLAPEDLAFLFIDHLTTCCQLMHAIGIVLLLSLPDNLTFQDFCLPHVNACSLIFKISQLRVLTYVFVTNFACILFR